MEQTHGDMTERNLLVAHTPELRALHKRGWIEHVDTGELISDCGDKVRYLPAWAVTPTGREALDAAVPLRRRRFRSHVPSASTSRISTDVETCLQQRLGESPWITITTTEVALRHCAQRRS